MEVNCSECILCRLEKLEEDVKYLPYCEETIAIKNEIEQLKLDIEVLKISKHDKRSH